MVINSSYIWYFNINLSLIKLLVIIWNKSAFVFPRYFSTFPYSVKCFLYRWIPYRFTNPWHLTSSDILVQCLLSFLLTSAQVLYRSIAIEWTYKGRQFSVAWKYYLRNYVYTLIANNCEWGRRHPWLFVSSKLLYWREGHQFCLHSLAQMYMWILDSIYQKKERNSLL